MIPCNLSESVGDPDTAGRESDQVGVMVQDEHSADYTWSLHRPYRPALRDLPRRTVRLFLLSLFGASLLGGVYLYTDNAYPHGPIVFTGEWRQESGPVYREDTSRLDNPAWVTAVRKWRLLLAGPSIILGIIALSQGGALRAAWDQTGRTLTVLQYLSQEAELYENGRRSLAAWRTWDARARVLVGLGKYAEALDSKHTAKQGEIWELRRNKRDMDHWDTPEHQVSRAEERHDREIAGLRSMEAEANPPK